MEVLRKKSQWHKIRSLFRTVHLFIGLACGIIIIPVCLAGTLYVFNTELTEMGATHLYKTDHIEGSERIPIDNVAKSIESISGGKITSVIVYQNPERTYQINIKKADDKSKSGVAWFADPYTGEIVGNSLEENSMKDFMSDMFSLHRWLLLDKIEKPFFSSISNRDLGSKITGWATILFTLGCLTGLIIWFPNKVRNWRQGLKIKMSGNWKRTNHDLHNSLAFYSLIFLLLMGLTGPQWSFDWYRTGLQKTLGTYKPPVEKKKSKSDESVSSKAESSSENTFHFTSYMLLADQEFDYAGNYSIRLPADQKSPVSISKTRVGFFAPAAGDKMEIDPISGTVLKSEIFSDKPFNERIAGSIKSLHVGNVYGTFTKWIYFFACLIATSLPVTGTIIWINRLKKRKKKKVNRV